MHHQAVVHQAQAYGIALRGDDQAWDITATPSGWDNELHVYSGSCGALSCEDWSDAGLTGDAESVTINTASGTTYYIYVGGWGTSVTSIDSFNLSITCIPLVSAPANDTCGGAITVTCSSDIDVSGLGASDADAPSGCSTSGAGLWYSFAGDDQAWDITATPSGWDNELHVYSGSCGALSCEDWSDGGLTGDAESVTINTASGTTYYIYVGGWGTSVTSIDSFNLSITCIPLVSAPANDTCGGAITVTCSSDIDVSGLGASDADAPSGCSTSGAGLWYSFAGDDQAWDITATPSGWDNELHVYSGSCGALSCEDWSDGGLTGDAESVTINTASGTTYYIYVGGWGTSVTSIDSFNLSITCIPLVSAPANDTCGGAITVTCSSDIDVSGLGASDADAPSGCSTSGAGLWYSFAGDDQAWDITATPSGWDNELHVYSGSCGALSCEDWSDAGLTGDAESVTINTASGTTYYIYVGGWGTSVTSIDSFNLSITCIPLVSAPANDTCGGAITVTCSSDIDVSGLGASDADAPSGCSTSGAGLWYSFAGDDQAWDITATPSGWDNELHVYSGSCGALSCEDWSDAGLTGDAESVTINTASGTTYYIYVGGWGTSVTSIDSFNLSITCIPLVSAPANDTCGGAITVTCSSDIDVSGLGASDADAPSGCSTSGAGLWYSFAGDDQAWDITATPSGWDNELHVYSGSCGALSCEDWSDAGLTGDAESVTINTASGTTYYIYVGGWGTSVTSIDSFNLSITCIPLVSAPANDTCGGAISVTCGTDIDVDGLAATDADAPSGCSGSGAGLWYTFEGDDQAWNITATPSGWDNELHVYSGSCGALSCEDWADTGLTGDAESVTINTASGTTYYIYVGHWGSGSADSFNLSIECSVPPIGPVNDECADAIETPVAPGKPFCVGTMGTTVGATQSDNAPSCSFTWYDDDVWYEFTTGAAIAPAGIVVQVNFMNQTGAGIAVYESCDPSTEIACISNSGTLDSVILEGIDLLPNTTYIVRVWSPFEGEATQDSFTICAYEIDPIALPPCDAPIALTVENISETTADLSWTPSGDETLWNIEIVDITGGGSFTGVPTESGLTDTFFLATGLTPANDYEFYVFADCEFDSSAWAGPLEFSTLVPLPANDTCGGALAVSCGTDIDVDGTVATGVDAPSGCSASGAGLWYSFTGDDQRWTITATPDGWDNEVHVYSGSCGALSCEDWSDSGISGDAESVSITTVSGTEYYVYVGHWGSGSSGLFNLSISCVTPPINDNCDGALEVNCDDLVFGSTANASPDESLPFCGTSLNSAPGVWYTFAGTGDDVEFALCDLATNYDTKLAVFEGSCDALSCIDGNDDECETQSVVSINSVPGTDYFIYVSGFGSNIGTFGLSVTCTVPPCDTADIALDLVTDAVCGNDGAIDITVSGGSGSFDILWSNGEITEDISGLAAGDYTVEVTDTDDGCLATATFTVGGQDALTEIEAAIIVGLPCDGGATDIASIDVTIGGGTLPYDYSWSNGETTEDISGLSEGSYTLTVTDTNNCTYTTQTFVIAPAGTSSIFEVVPAVVTNVDCFGNATGAIDISVSGGTAPYTYRWSNDLHTEDISGLEAGEYVFFVVDATGCEYTSDIIVVGEPDLLEEASAAIVTNAVCNGEASGSIDVSITGGTLPYSFVWTNGSTDEDPSGLAAGMHQATVTDANGCEFLTPVFVVGEPTVIQVEAIITNADCNGASTGLIDISVSGGTPGYTYLWSDGSMDEDLADAAAGDYNVIITDANGCSITSETFTIGEPSAIEITAISVTDADCNGASTGAIDISVSGGVPPYTYLWDNGDMTQDITDLAAGDYTGVITDASGCSFTSPTITVGEALALAVTTSIVTDVDCNGGSSGAIDITVDGGTIPYLYLWSNGETTQNITDLSADDYSVEITDANGCTLTSPTFTVAEPDVLVVTSVVVVNVLCNGDNNGSIDIEVDGGVTSYSYLWSNGEITQDISDLMAGDYIVVITDANGCELEATVTVNQPAAIFEALPPAITNISCNGEIDGAIDITIQGGTLPYDILWSNGDDTEDISDLAPGDYTYIVTDNNGCAFDSETITVVEPDVLSESAVSSDAPCLGEATGSIDLSVAGGTLPYTYVWSNGANSEDIDELFAGDYSVEITDVNGCTLTSATYTVGEPATELTATIAITDESSVGAGDGSATVTASGGDGTYGFNWADGLGISPTINDLTSAIYCVDVTDGNGCSITVCGTVGAPTAIGDIFQVAEITLYPNPTYDVAQLNVQFTKAVDVELAIVDVLGKVYENEYLPSTSELTKVFDMTSFAAGTYFIRIKADKEVITLPLVVQH